MWNFIAHWLNSLGTQDQVSEVNALVRARTSHQNVLGTQQGPDVTLSFLGAEAD